MGLLDRLKGTAAQQVGRLQQVAQRREAVSRGDEFHLHLAEREWDKPDDAGHDDVWGRGFMLHDDDGIGWRWDDPALAEAGVVICKVSGVTFYGDAIRRPSFAPGQRLTLEPEPDNPYDSSAVGVRDASGEVKVGHVPREICGDIARRLAGAEPLEAFSLWEWYTKPDEERVGLRILIAPTGTVIND